MASGTTCAPCIRAARSGVRPTTMRGPGPVRPTAPRDVLPFRVERIDRLLAAAAPDGDPDQITLEVLQAVYPHDVDGSPLDWGRLNDGDPWALHALKHRVHARVCAALATLYDAACDQSWRAAGFPVSTGTGGGGGVR